MAHFNLLQIVATRQQKVGVPQELEGIEKMLASFNLPAQAKQWNLDFNFLLLGIGQKLLKAVSESAFLAEMDWLHLQKRFNRFLRKTWEADLLVWFLKSLSAKYFQDPQAVWILDDTPLEKTGKKMKDSKKFYHNGRYYHGYELLTLVFSGEKGIFPLGKALKTSKSPSKIKMSCQLIRQAVSLGFRPRWIVFDAWYTVQKLLDDLMVQGLKFIGPLKKNRVLCFNGRHHHLDYFLKKAGDKTYSSFFVALKDGQPVRLVVFRRRLKSGKIQVEFLLTNDMLSSAKNITRAYLKRWGIETFFRASKQTFSLEDFHNRSLSAIQNHITLSFCAILLVAYLQSLFKSLEKKSFAFVRRVAFFKRIRLVLKAANGLIMMAWQIAPNPFYFKRFGVAS